LELSTLAKFCRLPFVWDYDIAEDCVCRLLAGDAALGRLGLRALVEDWPKWRPA
jgi:hypothetical protein